jgi:hypothetical protein
MKEMRRLVGLLTAASLSITACGIDQYDCLNEISEQTGIEPTGVSQLDCNELAELTGLDNPPENYTFLSTKNAAVISHCGSPEVAFNTLKQLQTCYDKLKSYLGIQPPTQCIMHTLSRRDDLQDIEDEYASKGVAGCFLIKGGSFDRDSCDPNLEEIIRKVTHGDIPMDETCYSAHEPTHVFVAGTIIDRNPKWLNEGLAELMKYELAPRKQGRLDCYPSSYVIVRNGEIIDFGSFVDLDKSKEEYVSAGILGNVYHTGACVWQYIIDEFGLTAFTEIMKNIEKSRTMSLSFEKDVLEPAIGRGGVDKLKSRFDSYNIGIFMD